MFLGTLRFERASRGAVSNSNSSHSLSSAAVGSSRTNIGASRMNARALDPDELHHFWLTIKSFSTPNTPVTSRALTPASVLSASLSTMPSNVVRPFFTMM
jgi:hypothetical protein